MRSRFACLTVLVAAGAFLSSVQGEEPAPAAAAKSSERMAAIEKGFREAVTAAADGTARSAAAKQRKADLRALLAEIESLPPEKIASDDHATAAQLYQRLGLPEEAVPHAEAAVAADPGQVASHALLVQALIANKQVDAAEQAFAKASEQLPKSDGLEAIRLTLASGQFAGGDAGKGADHLLAWIDASRGALLTRNDAARSAYLMRLEQALRALDRSHRRPAATAALDREIAAVEKLAAETPDAPLGYVRSELLANKVRDLALAGDKPAAETLLNAELANVQPALQKQPEDAGRALAVIPLLAAQADLAANDEAAKAAQTRYVDFLGAQLKQHVENALLLRVAGQSLTGTVSRLMASERSTAASALIDASNAILDDLEPTEPAAAQALSSIQSGLAGIARRLKMEESHAVLLGQDAVPIEPDAWVNGEPLTAEQLKGKVVLLDFWAVWCGPCIATFPHLREWQEKYADRGLVIVGVTNYYKYGWNAMDERAEPVEDITPEQERAALVEFAKFHKLQHRFAVMPEMSEFADKYGVTGIPQAVVIDRQGKIRLIRVGSGPENAASIETMLERLLGDAKSPCEGG